MAAYQAGEAEAFNRLYATLAPVVRRRLAALARDAAWVDDLVQETFLQIHRARRSYTPSLPVQPWALAIARHVFLTSLRTRRRRRYYDTADSCELESLSHAGHEAASLVSDTVRRCLGILTPRTREAVVLHHLVGLSFEEAGARLGMHPSAVRETVSRAVTRIRRQERRRARVEGGQAALRPASRENLA